ncbi:MAG: hypothetical protein K0R99_4477, partial [Microbacterium sp.]|uniref:hypothetical protein n=1 Tax=Microbacterium sp. TaxID=51671 RepID=UPI00261A4962
MIRPQEGGDARGPVVRGNPLRGGAPGYLAVDEGQDIPAAVVDSQIARRAGEAHSFEMGEQRTHPLGRGAMRTA